MKTKKQRIQVKMIDGCWYVINTTSFMTGRKQPPVPILVHYQHKRLLFEMAEDIQKDMEAIK